MEIKNVINSKSIEFRALCRSHKVEQLYAFGSSTNSSFNAKKSDIDVLVRLGIDDPADRGEALLSLWDQLELFFGRKVDLLTEDSLRNPYLIANINRTKVLVYDGNGTKVFV